MLEKLALLKIALCRAPVLSKASWRWTSVIFLLAGAGGGIEFVDAKNLRQLAREMCRAQGFLALFRMVISVRMGMRWLLLLPQEGEE